MTKIISGIFLLFAILLGQSLVSCKKPLSFSNGNLNFSTDTVVFDTVFTTVGSTTKRLKIYNPGKSTLKIDEIELMGGSSSPFRLNVDGLKGKLFSEIEMEKEDSLFIFVEVTLSVNNGTLPLIVEDRIRFRTNGKDQFVQLAAWGQDAYFHYKDINSGTWPNDKPHVIYDYAAVDSAQTLNIQPDTKIYLHKDAILYNYKGTLNINGTRDHEVILQGDRLEAFYQDQPGQFYGIYMQEARHSVIEHVIIKNGTAGIHLYSNDPSNISQYTLDLRFAEIYNNANYGLFLYSGAKVKAENCLIYKNLSRAVLVLEGGDFNFNYCNLLGYAASDQVETVGITNYFKNSEGVTNYKSINEGVFTNCVITGNQATEFAISTENPGGVYNLNFLFRNCLITAETIPSDGYFQNILWNQNPAFVNYIENDFNILNSSVLNGAADDNFHLNEDFDGGNSRSIPSDVGAYETN
ncbi:MAG: right-handed parallel beta-helix repeat-containing protein [Crocinitomicaceae bacterium]